MIILFLLESLPPLPLCISWPLFVACVPWIFFATTLLGIWFSATPIHEIEFRYYNLKFGFDILCEFKKNVWFSIHGSTSKFVMESIAPWLAIDWSWIMKLLENVAMDAKLQGC